MSSHVRQLQTTLKEAGFYTGKIDGIAGELTVEATKRAVEQAVMGSAELAPVNEQFISHPEHTEPKIPPAQPERAGSEMGVFTLSERSLKNLEGVHPDLVRVVKRAIELTSTDIAVIEGVRTLARQKELMRKGATKTLKSRHLTGHAVDIVPIVNGEISWNFNDYYPIAKAMAQAATELGVRVRWGGAWQVITNSNQTPRKMVKSYRDKGGVFLDGPHFELPA